MAEDPGTAGRALQLWLEVDQMRAELKATRAEADALEQAVLAEYVSPVGIAAVVDRLTRMLQSEQAADRERIIDLRDGSLPLGTGDERVGVLGPDPVQPVVEEAQVEGQHAQGRPRPAGAWSRAPVYLAVQLLAAVLIVTFVLSVLH